MADRKMSLNELSERVGIANVNLSKIKTGKVSAIRFSTLEAICEALGCQPGTDPGLPVGKTSPLCPGQTAEHLPAHSCRQSQKRLRRTAGNTLSPHGKGSSDVRKRLFHNMATPHPDDKTAQMSDCQGIDKNVKKPRVRH